jgi:hypothetical protein
MFEPFDIHYCTIHGEKCPDLKTAIENNKRVFWYECMTKKCEHNKGIIKHELIHDADLDWNRRNCLPLVLF